MRERSFRIVPLSADVVEAAHRALAAGAPDHALVRVNSVSGYPCRHCLRFAQPGECVILFPYASIEPGRPYSESGPIFVHEKACQPYADTAHFPADLRHGRVVRAYDAHSNMIDAVVVQGDGPEVVIEKMLRNPDVAFLQGRSVSRGCFTVRIERV